MSIGIAENLPPYVVFETRAEEDRQASIEAGHMVYKNIDYVIITPRGSKDRIERVVSEWLAHIDKESRQDRFDPRWVSGYRASYKLWQEGQEVPPEGTALNQWPGLSPAQVKNFNNLNVRSIEDVAAANEETLARMGHGARDLKARAIQWLESSKSVGQVSEQISSLKSENARLIDRNTDLQTKMEELSRRLASLETLGGGGNYIPNRPDPGQTPEVDFT
jgi:hypothetical protein